MFAAGYDYISVYFLRQRMRDSCLAVFTDDIFNKK